MTGTSPPIEGGPLSDGCEAVVSGLDPQVPGDVISPSASFIDAAGDPAMVIQSRWFLNGVNTTSIVWDGGPVTAELQYTCLDHAGASRAYMIEAFLPGAVVPAAPTEQPAPTQSPTEEPGAGQVGVDETVVVEPTPQQAGVAGTAESATAQNPGTDRPGSAAQNPAVIAGIAVGVVAGAAAVATGVRKVRTAATPSAEPAPAPGPPAGAEAPLTPDEIARLKQRRTHMQAEIISEKAKFQQVRRDRASLVRLLKKNLLKVIMKQAIETYETVTFDPEAAADKIVDGLTPKSLRLRPMERIFEKHDTSKDGQIVVEINNRIVEMKGQMQQHIDNVRYLLSEITKINQRLGGKG